MMPKPNPNMLCRKEVAARLGISIRTLERNLSDPDWRVRIGAKRIGRHWRFIPSRVQLMVSSTTY